LFFYFDLYPFRGDFDLTQKNLVIIPNSVPKVLFGVETQPILE